MGAIIGGCGDCGPGPVVVDALIARIIMIGVVFCP
ncbi:hypothetical protein GGR10_000600 [Bartonella chomelii]|uniref:Uncharacterized protein n=1 Tax=Bartonella chomelii TaxID=236402 RepID=A0ABR6E2G8_9HYPH|nr:hypothetical protein [Bartonella chomelii]